MVCKNSPCSRSNHQLHCKPTNDAKIAKRNYKIGTFSQLLPWFEALKKIQENDAFDAKKSGASVRWWRTHIKATARVLPASVALWRSQDKHLRKRRIFNLSLTHRNGDQHCKVSKNFMILLYVLHSHD